MNEYSSEICKLSHEKKTKETEKKRRVLFLYQLYLFLKLINSSSSLFLSILFPSYFYLDLILPFMD